ncbi:MAG TPA: hypothetical protein VHD36_23155 [Pirellulales bacterium]|nr:hypothetical protein [Pirellulales bacterium]
MPKTSLYLSVSIGAALLLLSHARGTEKPPELVGDWGRVERLVIEGARSHNPETIRLATRRDVDCIAASRTAAPLEDYPPVLADRVRAGYIAQGFLDAQVGATIDRQREVIVISVIEGQQYLCGPIEIEGGAGIDADRLRDWITSGHPAADARLAGFDETGGRSEPRWVGPDGSLAEFSEPAWQPGRAVERRASEALERAVGQGLHDQGFRSARFTVTAEPVDGLAEVPLVINIADAGPLARIDRIDVTGSERDSADDVRSYLGVKPGDVYTNFLHARLWHKLWSSGRYLDHVIEAAGSPDEEHSIRLEIKLVDYAPATPLAAPLQPAEQALLKMRDWILGAGNRGEDLVLGIRLPQAEYDLVYSEKQGLFAHLGPAAGSENEPGPDRLGEAVFVARPGEIALLHEPWQKKYQAAFQDVRLTFRLQMQAHPTPKPEGEQFSMQLGLGFKHSHLDDDEIPLRLAMDLSPVAFLSLAHRQDGQCTIADGLLTIVKSGGADRVRVETETGRLLEWSTSSTEGQYTLAVEQGALAKRMADIEARLPTAFEELPNDYDPSRFFGTLGKALLESPLPDYLMQVLSLETGQRTLVKKACHSLAKLCAAGVLQPLDDLGILAPLLHDDDAPAFFIPLAPHNRRPLQFHSAIGANAYLLARFCDDVFPHGSWPWIMWRNLILHEFGRNGLSEDLRVAMADNQIGPVGILCLAYWPNMPASWVAGVTLSALERTTSRDFARDYQSLLARGALVGDLVYRLAEALRDLTDEEIAPFDTILFGADREVLTVAARTLRERRDRELSAVIPEVLNQIWNDALREHVLAMLRELHINNQLAARQAKVEKPQAEKPRAKEKSVHDSMPEQPALRPRSPDEVLGKPKPGQ